MVLDRFCNERNRFRKSRIDGDRWRRRRFQGWPLRVVAGELIEENHIEQGLVHLDAAVITDQAESAKAIHEEADARARGSDHLGQGFLRNGGDVGCPLAGLAELGHQQKNSRQTFFARVEELINQIGLGFHAAFQQELHKKLVERRVLMHQAEHFFPVDLDRRAGVYRRGRGHAWSNIRRHGPFSEKIAGRIEADGGFLAGLGDHGELGAPSSQIEDGVARIPLAKEGVSGFIAEFFSACSRGGKKGREVYCLLFVQNLQDITSTNGLRGAAGECCHELFAA